MRRQRHSSSSHFNCRHAFASSRRKSPELCFVTPPSCPRGRREGRVPAGTRGPLREKHTQENRAAAYRCSQSLGLPCAMVGRLMPCSPGSRTFPLASLTPRIDDAVRPVGLAHTFATGLTVATTARTTRFCRTRSASFVCTWCRAHRDYPPCPQPIVPTLPRPPQARLAIRDDARSPLKVKPGWAIHTTKPNFGKVEYF